MDTQRAIKFAVEGIMEVIESAKNIELVFMTEGGKHETMSEEAVQAIVT